MSAPCVFSAPLDPNHCWHWDGKGLVSKTTGLFAYQCECCHCGRVGLRLPKQRPPDADGHGPYFMPTGSSANDADYVA